MSVILQKVPFCRCITTSAASSTCNAVPDNPTSDYYFERVREAAPSDDPAALVSLLNERVRDRFFNTSKASNFLTNTTAYLSSLPSLIVTLSCLSMGFARKKALDALVHRLCELEQRDHARHVLDVLSKLRHGLNAATFLPFIMSVDHQEARLVVKTMREHQVPRDTAACNFLLMACCGRCDVGSAAGVCGRVGCVY